MIFFFGNCQDIFSKEDTNFKWQGKWITFGSIPTAENCWTSFVKEIDISSLTDSIVIARIAVDSKYWLWINGKQVVFEGELKRGPTPNDTYFDEVNIAPYLQKGNNVIAVLVWFWGKDGFCHNNSGQMGLLFDAQAKVFSILSDGSWKSMTHPAFGNTSDPIPNYRLPEYNVKFNASKDISDWLKTGYTNQWSLSREIGTAGCKPWNKLWKRPFPQWKNSGLVEFENKLQFPFVTDGNTIRMKLPKNYSITPYFQIESEDNITIDIRTDNYKGGSEYNVRTEYVTKSGIQEFETFGYMNGHEVIYSIPKGVKILDLKYRRTSFPTEHVGKFVSNNQALNSLWEKSLNTMDLNMRDAIQDPDRERSQWWGDAVTILGEILYTCDANGQKAIQKAISNLVEWQKPDGVLFSPIPAGNWDKELPSQMLASIGKYGFWRYFEYTGDTAMVKYFYPHVKRYLSIWEIAGDGLIKHRDGGWNWNDWGGNIDEKVIENAWYYMALDGAKKMAELLNLPGDQQNYQSQMNAIKLSFNKKLWNGKAYRSPEYKGETDDRGNGLAVVSGLADSTKFDAVKNVLIHEFHAGPYIEKYILEALFVMGYDQLAIERMQSRYAKMISSPITTLWEGWDVGSAEFGGGSYNHGWSGGPLTLMHEYIAGIAPVDAGYKKYSIMPRMGDLSSIHCVTPTPKGDIKVDIKKQDETIKMDLIVPENTQATIGIPKAGTVIKKIYANNVLLITKERSVSKEKGIKYLGEDENYILFQVLPGPWTFSNQKR